MRIHHEGRPHAATAGAAHVTSAHAASAHVASAFALAVALTVASAALALVACSQSPPSWDRLLTAKITDMYPSYRVTQPAPGALQVDRPGQAPQTIAVAPIALLCQRGPKECDYAVDQMLLSLRTP